MNDDVEHYGFSIVRGVLPAEIRRELISTLGPVLGAGRRGLLGDPTVAKLSRSDMIMSLVRPHLHEEPLPVRAIYFDKTPDANWLVTWNQDLTLAIRARVELAGFGSWSVKDGVPHVQPPIELLERMLTVRLHLDDADEDTGALRVLPGSHRTGRLSSADIHALRERGPEVVCSVAAGDALLMRPLLLHASSRSRLPRHRRVLHIEFAGFALPAGLQWHEAT